MPTMTSVPRSRGASHSRYQPSWLSPLRVSDSRAASSGGFTLIELVVVVIMIGILATVAVAGYTRFIRQSEADAASTSLADLARGVDTLAVLRGEGTYLEEDVTRAYPSFVQNADSFDDTPLAPATAATEERQVAYALKDASSTRMVYTTMVDKKCAVVEALVGKGLETYVTETTSGTCDPLGVLAPGVVDPCDPTPTDPVPCPVPAAPAFVTPQPGDRQVILDWDPVTSPGLLGYRILIDDVRVATLPAGQTSYQAVGLENGTLYNFKVLAYTTKHLSPPAMTNATPTASPTTSTLPPPTNFASIPASGEVALSWSYSNPIVTGFELTVGTDPPIILPANARSYTKTGLTNGTSYQFSVLALNNTAPITGVSSLAARSAPAVITDTPGRAPASPSALRTAPGDGSIKVSWQAPAASDPAIAGYELYLDGVAHATTTSTEITLSGLVNERTYAVEVASFSGSGSARQLSPRLGPVSGTPTARITAPLNLVLAPGATSMTLYWNPPSRGTPLNYRIYVDGHTAPAAITSNTQYTFNNLVIGRSYSFAVSAVSTTMESPKAGPVSGRAGTLVVPLSRPTNVSTVASNTQVVVHWAPPEFGNPDGYRVFVNGSNTPAATVGVAARSVSVTGLRNNQTYTFQVEAYDTDRTGPRTDPVSATPQGPPNAPSSLSVTANNGYATMRWAVPAEGSPWTGYEYYINGSYAGSVGADATSTTINGLTNGVTYTFYVRAFNAAGYSPASPSASGRPFGPPNEMFAAAYESAQHTAIIYWNNSDAGNPAAPVETYSIERSVDGVTNWTRLGAVILPQNNYYEDTAVYRDQTYHYRVVATNARGQAVSERTTTIIT